MRRPHQKTPLSRPGSGPGRLFITSALMVNLTTLVIVMLRRVPPQWARRNGRAPWPPRIRPTWAAVLYLFLERSVFYNIGLNSEFRASLFGRIMRAVASALPSGGPIASGGGREFSQISSPFRPGTSNRRPQSERAARGSRGPGGYSTRIPRSVITLLRSPA
jgi:hypothetical protein